MSTEVVEQLHAMQYTGGNGAALVAAIDSNLVSDNGSQLTFNGPPLYPYLYTVQSGQWVVWFRNPDVNIIDHAVPNASYQPRYVNLAQKIMSVVVTGVAGMSLVQSSGGPVAVPASLLGQTANYDVTMSPALPSTSYKPVAQLRGAPNIVSGHSILGVTVISNSVVRVQVQSGAASLAGAAVHVNAWAVS